MHLDIGEIPPVSPISQPFKSIENWESRLRVVFNQHKKCTEKNAVKRIYLLGVARATNPQNYRMRVPPYGYSIQNGKLVVKKSELKISRLIVECVQRQGMKQNAVARELSERGYKNRAGSRNWNSKTMFNIINDGKEKSRMNSF